MMTTLDSSDANIVEGDFINWRLVLYPIVAAVILILSGLVYYFYLQNQREELEASAREALLQAKTPEALVAVADQFPATEQAAIALLNAAGDSFDKKDYAAASRDYQRIIGNPNADALLRDSAQMGLASTLEVSGKADDAINAYLTVAHRGNESPYAPAAYYAVASIYRQRGDKANEQGVLIEEAALDPESSFVKEAQQRLKELNFSEGIPTTSNAVMTTPKS
ncbi:MAG: tetratricopeptide repeat protein [Methylacidiphilales bacterium]|nr:tetratricopeptide repeat protein [Candidatus Methylacidiphilales bacterium]